jgi:hypothetical protein
MYIHHKHSSNTVIVMQKSFFLLPNPFSRVYHYLQFGFIFLEDLPYMQIGLVKMPSNYVHQLGWQRKTVPSNYNKMKWGLISKSGLKWWPCEVREMHHP